MRLKNFNRTLFHPGQRICCALSGGADSTALLLALLEANGEQESLGAVLSAVHIHHGLRGDEADADEAFVCALCTRHGIPLTVKSVDTPARQQAEREGLEQAARHLRYDTFLALLTEGQIDAVATAHTLEDQAETVLMKFLRGAWTEGLGGISPILNLSQSLSEDLSGTSSGAARGRETPTYSANALRQSVTQSGREVLRPMLYVRRGEVERFLQERAQPWREDSSNQDTSFTRNRVRHELMPLLRSFNPQIDEALARTAGIARDDEAYWQAETARLLPSLALPGKPVRGGGRAVSTGVGERSLALELDRLRAQPPALRRRLLRAAGRSLGCRLDADQTARLLALGGLLDLPGLPGRNGARLELANGLRAERSLRELRLSRLDPAAIPKKV